MRRLTLIVLVLIASVVQPRIGFAGASPRASMTEAAYRALPNLVANGSFEMDWMHNRVTVNTRFLLLEQSDWGYAHPDGQPDYWMLAESSRIDTQQSRFGKSSLRLKGTAGQVVYLLGETDPRGGGAYYNPFKPLPRSLLAHVKPRALRFGAWCKTQDAKVPPSLFVTMEYGADKITSRKHAVAFGKGTHDWEYQELTIPAAADLGPPHCAVIRLEFTGDGAAWFDGVYGEETLDDSEVNLLANGGFEDLDKDWPIGWSAPVLWSWARNNYYRFTGWSHGQGKMTGGALVAPLGKDGGRALQFTLLPGDNLAVQSAAIKLNQDEARVLEVSAWVKTQDLRYLEIMAQDEKGQWLPQQDFAGCMGTDEHYRNRVAGIGTHDWEFVRKHFAPKGPIRELTLWLCARGFDGKLMERNVVGTVWFDDISLRERGTARADLEKRRVPIPPATKVSDPLPYRIVSLDLGERLWGTNEVRMTVVNPTGKPVTIEPWVVLSDPAKRTHFQATPVRSLKSGETATIAMPYVLSEMAADWTKHFRFEKPCAVRFGTPPSPISLRIAGSYYYPDEKIEAGINLNIAQASLKEVARCQVAVRQPGGDKIVFETDDISKSLWNPSQERPALLRLGFVPATNLIAVSIPAAGIPVHPHHEPVRDCQLVATLFDRQGKIIATRTSEWFGFLDKPAGARLPDKIVKTEVIEGGTLLVNGKPFIFNCFPFSATDLGNVSRTLNFPATHKVLALPYPKGLLFGPEDEPKWKEKVEDFVRANKDDPKLFGYFFNHDGETSFWFKKWQDAARCQGKVAEWVRALDPNHVVMSAHWLFGHGGLTPESAKHFANLDVLDVEPGLTWTPDAHSVRRATGRPNAVIAGLECYYFQPPSVLRWRTYEALRQGANGIGICPSGMLAAKPEIISYLRGLHGEIDGLEPLLTGKTPTDMTKTEDPAVTVWERQAGKTRYVVAMVGERLPDNRQVAFTLSVQAEKGDVMFEARTIAVKAGRFMDVFETPYTVHVYRFEMK